MERTDKYPRLVTLVASAAVIEALYLTKGVLIPFALAMLVSSRSSAPSDCSFRWN